MADNPNLRRLVLEGGAVVVSILLAFSIDAWWDLSREHAEEREALTALRDEFWVIREDLDERTARNNRYEQAGAELLVYASGDAAPRSAESLDTLFWQIQQAPTWNPWQGVHASLMNSGELALIESRTLREHLAAWPGVVENVRDNELLMRGFIFDALLPTMARLGTPIVRIQALERDEWPASVPSSDAAMRAYLRLLENEEFQGYLAVRYNWTRLLDYSYWGARASAQRAVELIDSELAR